jgi:hypothetical protein
MARPDACDAAAGEVRLLPRHAAPHIDAAIGERALVRIELRPYRGMDAVARHQHVALSRLQRSAVRRDEARGNPRIALLDADAAVTGDEALHPEPVAHRIQKNLMQVGAVDGKMRPLMPGREPHGSR